MSRRLILHAGTHKTGTTSIQKVLADNREWLQQRGLYYPPGGSAFGRSDIPHHLFCRALNGIDPDGPAKSARFLDEAERASLPSDTIVLSSEAAYRHVYGYAGWDHFTADDYWPMRVRYLERLAGALATFDTEVLLFFRDREEFARSLYGELVLRRKLWQGDPHSFRSAFAPWFDYERQIETFRHTFAKVRVLSYDEACRTGLVATFFATIGFAMPDGAESVWKRRSSALRRQIWQSSLREAK